MNMNSRYARPHLAEVAPQLVATARGDLPATLVIRGGRLVNVVSGEILEGMSVAVQGARIALVGQDASHTIGPDTKVIEADGRYIAPGLLDGHCHIESSQLTVTQFARAVLPHGTTGGFFDAHEICNVLGLRGLRLMLEEARLTPLAAYMQVASCVPSASPELETAGAAIGPAEVAEAMSWGADVIALGEVMNFPGVVYGDPKMLGEIQATLRAGRVADGHFMFPPNDWRLSAYAASGVTGDHECVTMEDVIERVRLGMYAMMRRGSAWHDVAATIRAHTERGLDPRRMMLVTDDRSAESLQTEGHMDFVLRDAIRQGVRPLTAFQMATINTAERFGVARDVGAVIPGNCADILLLDGLLADVNVSATIAAGVVVAEHGRMTAELEPFAYPQGVRETVRVAAARIRPEAFRIVAPITEGTLTARVIEVQENHVETKELLQSITVRRGEVVVEGSGLCKLAVFERHGRTGEHAVGLLSGVTLTKPAALAMTVAHDSHNLLVLGNDDGMLAQAAQAVAAMQGGIAVVTERGVTRLPLPIAGIMSDAPFEDVVAQGEAVSQALQESGCMLNHALMTLSLLALVVIPTLRLSDKGLIKVTEQGFVKVPLFVEE